MTGSCNGQAGTHRLLNYFARELAQHLPVRLWCRRRSNARDHPIVAVGWDGSPIPQNAVVEVLAVANRANAAPDHVAHHRDATVGGSKMFEAMPRDAAVNAHLG